MVDVFRYIEHDYAVPAKTDAVDIANDSDFQQSLADARTAERAQAIANGFLGEHFASPVDDPTASGGLLDGLASALGALAETTPASVRDVIAGTFGVPLDQVVEDDSFASDRELLENAVLAVKLTTGFDQVDAERVVRQLRATALLTHLAENPAAPAHQEEVATLLARPIRIPSGPLAVVVPAREPAADLPPADDGPPVDEDARRLYELRLARDQLRASYDALLAVRPEELELHMPSPPADELFAGLDRPVDERYPEHDSDARSAGTAPLLLGETVLRTWSDDQLGGLARLRLDPAETPVPLAIDRIEHRLRELNEELLPAEAPTQALVFQVGGRIFAEPAPMKALSGAAPQPMPDFSKAVTRPVGIGNLQVVRQELIGYVAGEISRIENVLPGELLRRSTERSEFSETVETDEVVTTQSEERDLQSTERNELSTEMQRESGRQTSTSGDGMTSSDYGRLVENSKSKFAQTVSAKSVQSLTQQVRKQRVRRESRSYTERVRHVLDNSTGTTEVRGIYQWVDKRFSLRVLNYGKRLMYDVVVPEPAAVLIQAMKDAVRPESFQLTKPLDPGLLPSQINAGNYMWYAAQYGVTGSVNPPPAVFAKTFATVQPLKGSDALKAYGQDVTPAITGAFKLTVPDDYKAVRGFVQTINASYLDPPPGRTLEVYVGESQYHRIMSPEHPYLNKSFTMAGEVGDIPVTYRTFPHVVSIAFAVGVICQRTNEAYAQWQLKTHAAIVAGYQRQLAEYEDKLSRYVAAMRAQLAATGGYAHDPAVVRDELKRAFIFLLLGEHPTTWLPTPAPAPAPPAAALPDPKAVRDWGAGVAFFERAFEWENLMYFCYPYYWARPPRWQEMVLTQDADPQFETFLKAGAARVVVPVRPGFEAALAHYQETGAVWMGEEIPDMFGDHYLSIIEEIKAANYAPGDEVCVDQWELTLPTTLVLLKDDATLPSWPATPCTPPPEP